jgi:protein translocase SecG subunit
MVAFPLLAVGIIMNIVAVMFGLCCVVLILVILIQKGRGGGLSAAFGGGGGSSILGSKTGDFLTWVTIILVGLFLLLAVVMGKFYRPGVTDFGGGAATGQNPPPADTEGAPTTIGDANAAESGGAPGG